MRKKIAIFPAGSEIGLEIQNALKYSTFFETFGLTSVDNHAKFVYKNYINNVPLISAHDFFERLNEILTSNQIEYIFPALDDVQLFLMQNANKIAATIISPELTTVETCRSKIKTYKFLKPAKFIPKYYENYNEIESFPVFAKPDVGQGSQGVQLINTKEDLISKFTTGKYVFCEYLPGEEYTVDCFSDASNNLIDFKLRNRKRIRTGISVSSEILPFDKKVQEIAEFINKKFKFQGVWFFQLKKDAQGEYKLLEVAPRVAGTMGITRNTGTNYPLMAAFLACGYPVTPITNKYEIEVDRAFISRYNINYDYDYVYLDLDDTLIVNEQVNTLLMLFIFQCKNKGKHIILITKHKIDPKITLDRYNISINIFDKIIGLTQSQNKFEYIDNNKSIFIDDSFSERLAVYNACNIPVFDCSEIESLIDWRL